MYRCSRDERRTVTDQPFGLGRRFRVAEERGKELREKNEGRRV